MCMMASDVHATSVYLLVYIGCVGSRSITFSQGSISYGAASSRIPQCVHYELR